MEDLKIFSGSTHPELGERICRDLDVTPGRAEFIEFSNENLFVRILENVRDCVVFAVQPFSSPVQRSIMEFLIMLDALRRAGAKKIVAVIPYYGYGRSDKKDQPHVPITARLLADLITAAGASHILTVDLHSPQIQGFFNIPVDEISGFPLLRDYYRERREELGDLVVVAPDLGAAKRARNFALSLDAPPAVIEKMRGGNVESAKALSLFGEVRGKTALLVDDEVNTGGSLIAAAHLLLEKGAREVRACCVHPILSKDAPRRIDESPIKELVVTDTVPVPEEKRGSKIKVITIAPLLAEAIRRIYKGLPVEEIG